MVYVATLMEDGSPQITPKWVDVDESQNTILVNTAKGCMSMLNSKYAYTHYTRHMGYRVICERHNLKQFCNTMMEAKAVQIQHKREGCLESEIKKPGQR